MKGPVRGELEVVDDRGDLPEYLEGAVLLQRQLHRRVT